MFCGDQIILPGVNRSGAMLQLRIRISRLAGLSGEEAAIPDHLVLEAQPCGPPLQLMSLWCLVWIWITTWGL